MRRASPWRLVFVATCLGAIGGAGCGKRYLRVDVEYAAAQGDRAEPSVNSTDAYRERARDLKTVSVRLPEYCLNESAAQATGRAGATDLIMESSCAVWLAELERALVGGGYRVISWDTLYELERTRNLSTYVAAAELGADAVIMVNSLEANVRDTDSEAEATVLYFHARPDGRRVAPAELAASTRSALKRLIRRNIDALRKGARALSAALDATVVMTDTGEASWFYRWNLSESSAAAGNVSFLFRGRGVHLRPVLPRGVESAPDFDERASVETASVERPGSVDPYKRGRMRLVRTVARDFVNRFKQGAR